MTRERDELVEPDDDRAGSGLPTGPSSSSDPPGERTFRLTVAYDGTNYTGWQRQINGVAIQQLLEEALLAVTSQATIVNGSGRTDSGVHARGQVCSFRVATSLPPGALLRAVQSRIPRDVVAIDLRETLADFHAQRRAIGKRYRYCIDDGPTTNPFLARYAWRIPYGLDVARMREAAARFVGTHDFKTFQAAGAERKGTVRTIAHARVAREESAWGEALWFDVAANGFLYRMVRNLVGCLVEVGRGSREPAWIDEALAARTRSLKFPTAPPHGLFLWSVDYDARYDGAPMHDEAPAGGTGQGRGVDDARDETAKADGATS